MKSYGTTHLRRALREACDDVYYFKRRAAELRDEGNLGAAETAERRFREATAEQERIETELRRRTSKR